MRTVEFDYDLPDQRIARVPADRGTARLLVLDAAGDERHRSVAELPSLLEPGDLLVVNDTRVLRARLHAERVPGGGRVELLLLDAVEPTRWRALARPARRLAPGTELVIAAGVTAVVEERCDGGVRVLRFSEPVHDLLERRGEVPLPPYLKRGATPDDREWYQTVYARVPGAVAAPTAGLHLTREILEAVAAAGVERAAITLHVGPGTFKPVTAERVDDHHLDAERYVLSEETRSAIARTRARGGRVVAVGTTVVRCLETAAAAASDGLPTAGAGVTALFIRPGFRFRVVDALLSNFHLPRSTLLMLVAAFSGTERVLAAYREAIEREYRFYSYGDAMLALRRSDAP